MKYLKPSLLQTNPCEICWFAKNNKASLKVLMKIVLKSLELLDKENNQKQLKKR